MHNIARQKFPVNYSLPYTAATLDIIKYSYNSTVQKGSREFTKLIQKNSLTIFHAVLDTSPKVKMIQNNL